MFASDAFVVVILASANRPELLRQVIEDVCRQSFSSMKLVVSVPDDSSLPTGDLPSDTVVVYANGLAAQRNAGLVAVPMATHVFFFDDDAVIDSKYVEHMLDFFGDHPTYVAATGRVVLDGATKAEVSRSEAESALRRSAGAYQTDMSWRDARELYGCNFAFRPPLAPGMRFDDRLPLYSWLEDLDFCQRILRYGKVAQVNSAAIVHRGVKSGGRVAHQRLGYAQVMNPAYLFISGSFSLLLALRQSLKLVAKNLVLSVAGNQRTSRRQRLLGNGRAGLDVLRFRFTPERILEFDNDLE